MSRADEPVLRRPLPLTLLLGSCILAIALIAAPEAPLLASLHRTRATGWAALGMLIGALSCPLFGRRIAPWRRAFGVTSAVFATLHVGYVLRTDLVPDLDLLIYEPLLRAGAATYVALVVLGVTSHTVVHRRVRRWKDLHALAYVAGGLACLHVLLSPHAWAPTSLIVAAILVAGVVARALDRRRWS